MDIVEQLWILKQTFVHENSGYDSENKIITYQIPDYISAEDIDALKENGRLPNELFKPSHNEIMEDFYRLTATWTLREASNAFIAGLWSEAFLWQNALTAKVMSMVMPDHDHTPYSSSSSDRCGICGYQNRTVNVTNEWYYSMISGTFDRNSFHAVKYQIQQGTRCTS